MFRSPAPIVIPGTSQTADAMREVTNRDSCANCLKECEDEETHLICSACRTAAYCCKNCQVSHWKSHKPRCKAKQKAKKAAQEQGAKREWRLLEDWKCQAKSGILGYVCLSLFGFGKLKSLAKNETFVSLTVEFNYNKRTFVPVEKPELVPLSVMEEANPTFAVSIRKAFQDTEAQHAGANVPNRASILILLTTKGTTHQASLMPLSMEAPTSPLTSAKWNDLLVLMSQIRLKSRLFDAWIPLCHTNTKQQMEIVRTHPQFHPFLVNALRIETAKDTRHKTHIVVVFMEMGPGLGQVLRLNHYEVWPVSKVQSSLKDLLAEDAQQQQRQQLEYYNTHLFDLENSPTLLQTRRQRPLNALLPVVFCAKHESLFVMPNFSEVHPNHNIHPTSKCDKKARKAFQQLAQVKFPAVNSPELQ